MLLNCLDANNYLVENSKCRKGYFLKSCHKFCNFAFMKHNIGLLGFGTVGQGIAEILLQKRDFLKNKFGFEFEITAVAGSRYGSVYNPLGLDIGSLLKDAQNGNRFSKDQVDWDNAKLIKDTQTDIWCELTYTNLKDGGAAVDHVKKALSAGKHAVSSNKGPVALFYAELSKLAKDHGVRFLNEGTVVAGTPVLNLVEGPLAGCEISKISGVLNGTTNFMLTEMENGIGYETILKIAQEKGYAEADPTGDVEGHDARAKVTILANIVLDVPISISEVSCEGITNITPEDIKEAQKAGKRWKLIASVERNKNGISAQVKPEMVPIEHPLAGVSGTMNALTFTTDLLGDVTIVGPGAGKTETGFAILNDLLRIHLKK